MNDEELPGPTSSLPQHEWLKNLVGEWETETDLAPESNGSTPRGKGRESFSMFGDLWLFGEGEITFPDGSQMSSKMGIGYDVSEQAYRAFWIATVSSHLWKYNCELSEDGKLLTMNCEGPDMMGDSQSAFYRDFIKLIDEDHRTHTSTMQDKQGNWVAYMKNYYTRVK